mmetsp:Transcript_32935/g.98048  ORF Transcript_32935/g.98048 Transcript_32935/m.98048 type:complete len:258 (-) Transcript_32935:360-1133(-)
MPTQRLQAARSQGRCALPELWCASGLRGGLAGGGCRFEGDHVRLQAATLCSLRELQTAPPRRTAPACSPRADGRGGVEANDRRPKAPQAESAKQGGGLLPASVRLQAAQRRVEGNDVLPQVPSWEAPEHLQCKQPLTARAARAEERVARNLVGRHLAGGHASDEFERLNPEPHSLAGTGHGAVGHDVRAEAAVLPGPGGVQRPLPLAAASAGADCSVERKEDQCSPLPGQLAEKCQRRLPLGTPPAGAHRGAADDKV